ncbi:MAG: RICIN domain-containing protein [Microbacterium sp.]|uniref:glycoside hydrolase n=1 Tax=Microbacterium sp. TaxID=51671 RepID=UPI001ACA02CE|nr:glycoside hydrolase [Microbacterium sp.]MBN9176504.1 RICIN domain-containing protein [Microbacterium sp.]
MTSHRLLSLVCAGALAASGLVAGAATASPAVSVAAAATTTTRITPNPTTPGEPFEGWGTSLVWFANATGNYPADVRQDLFDAVFGEEGLNLNIARYNIGGGNATDVPSYLRPGGAVPGWWNPDLDASDGQGEITSTYADRDRYAAAWNGEDPASYDFDADGAQRWWIDALKDKVTHWEAFSNSPPYFLTESGFVSGGINNATSEQLPTSKMDDFASYLVNVVEELERAHGIHFDTLDPFNEPNTNYWQTRIPAGSQWPTSASRQEGAHIGPARQDQMIQVLAERLAQPGTTTDVKISAMDETNPSIFVQNWNGWSTQSKGLVDQLNVHTYGTGDRLVARDIAKASDKPLWMSEVEGDWDGTGFNQTNIENGLGMAARIVDDLRELEPSAWVFWQPVEDLYNMQRVEKLNWGSVFIDFDCNADGNSERRLAAGEADPSCKVLTNAKFNTVRNFTHYIQPGDRLIPTDNTQTTAALTDEGVTLVHINSDAAERDVQLDLSRFGEIAPGATVTPIVTTQSSAQDVTDHALVAGAPVAVDAATKSATLTVPAKSVTTFIVTGVSGVAADAAVFEDGETYQLIGVQSGKALTAGAGLAIRTSGVDAASATPQAWTVESISGAGTNRHRIALKNADGRYLGVDGTSTRLVTAAAAADDPSLQWIPTTTDGKTWSLLSVSAERVLDVNGQGTADGTTVGTWTSNNGGNQRWTPASTRVEGIVPVTAATVVGEAPALPAAVTLQYRGGVTRTASVEWDLAGADFSAPGTARVTGHGTDIFGAPFTGAVATIEVGAYAATRPVSLTTYAGATLAHVQAAAPASVPAEVRLGGTAYDAPVTWEWGDVTDASFANTGVVSVPGTITTGDGTVAATLNVIVTAASERNVAPNSRASATFTESASYSVDRTKNGVTSDKGWSNWRSGTKNAQDTLTYVLAGTEQVGHVKVFFYRDGGTTWAQTLRVEHRTAGGEWVAGEEIDVPAPATGAPVVDVPLGGVTADEVRVVLQARPATHMIVSEVEIYGLAAAPAGIADLARLVVGGNGVDGFAADRLDYDVVTPGSAWPQVSAVAVDADARVQVVQPADGAGVATVTVTAPDETSKTYRVAVQRTTVLGQVSITGTAEVGSQLSASALSVDPVGATLAYQWTRDGEPLADATAPTYTVTAADVDRELRVAVTAVAEGFVTGDAVVSSPIVGVAAPTGPGTGEPGTGEPGTGLPETGGPGAPASSALTDQTRGPVTAPSTVTAGTAFTVGVGAGRAGASVDAWLFSSPVHLGTRTVSAAGEISVTIPADTAPGAHRLAVTDADGALIGWAPVTVRAPGDLAATGGQLDAVLPLGALVALLAGLALTVAVRRSRRARVH